MIGESNILLKNSQRAILETPERVITVMRRHDLTNKMTMTKTLTRTKTMTMILREHLQKVTLETCGL